MLVGSQTRRVAILGGVRTPFARAHGSFANVGNQDMLTAAFKGVVDRFGLRGERLDDVAGGAVMKHSRDWNLVRECVLGCGLAPETPGVDLQRACGTSLEAAVLIGMKIELGMIECGMAGGVDTVSDPPVVFGRDYQQLLLRSFRGRTFMEKVKPFFGVRPRHFKPVLPGVVEPRTGLSMGQSTELMVKQWKVTREEQDLLALESHRRAAAAWESGFYDDLVIEYQGLKTDNNVRRDSSLDKLAKLKPSFDFSGAGSLTAGNSSPLTDGASAVLLASEEWARARRLPVRAYLSHAKVAAVDFVNKEGLLMAPAYAVPRMLADARLTLQDFDYYEIHEAFAAQVLCTLKAWESAEFCRDRLGLAKPLGSIDRARLNVMGGSVAIGHPFAATGTRIVATLAKILEQKNARRGLVSVCTAGGMGVTAILER
ncbi:MAG TPA: acetyl-CoA C-acetyltransferase [Steroidobacteraceae bacterium]|nr:acetyl-CoA C-acetyltransferase [Steroidobacteraceae bacterium]